MKLYAVKQTNSPVYQPRSSDYRCSNKGDLHVEHFSLGGSLLVGLNIMGQLCISTPYTFSSLLYVLFLRTLEIFDVHQRQDSQYILKAVGHIPISV